MERKDYLCLHDVYSRLKDHEERYRKELLDFIYDAFDKHGGPFELKPEGCATWEERKKDDDFNALDELPYYLLIGVDGDNSHEIHISKIHDIRTDWGYRVIEVDGWDWSESEFVERWDAYYDIESLSTIADFINAALEQEQEGMSLKVN